MAEPISHAHHYVPQWYQKRFLVTGEQKLWRLDLHPEKVVNNKQKSFTHRALGSLYPAQCFYRDDLYLLRFGSQVTDRLEKVFFGAVDNNGCDAGGFFEAFNVEADGLRDAYNGLLAYLAAQRLRTPRGLDWIKSQWSTKDQNQTLIALQKYHQAYDAMLMEGVWEIVHARNSATKFIISDNPVTFFNRKIYPNEQQYPGADDFPRIGTRTLFPLGAECCLIVTHLELCRNPWCDPLKLRENARLFGTTLGQMTAIQHSRALEETEVLRINYILKLRANKFIGSGRKDDLYPENKLGTVNWAKIDDDWFLFPHLWKVSFTTGIIWGGDGWSHSIDEYGRDPIHPKFKDPRRRRDEHRTSDDGKHEWARKRIGKSRALKWENGGEDSVADRMMDEYLQEGGFVRNAH